MNKTLQTLLILFLSFNCFSYDKPNSIAYDPITKSYFISNLAGKSITRLDSNFNTKEIITGLKQPKDILFDTFGVFNGLLILDSNKVLLYDGTKFTHIVSFAVNGAIDLEDCEVDKVQQGVFYMTDSKAHKIFKGEIGPPPFFVPTFTVLSTQVRNPKALLFDSKNRLLVSSDTISSSIYSINTATGNASLIKKTNVDLINSVEEDLEGNFYASSWGDSYLYRFDNKFENAKGLVSYSKPSGLYLNRYDDLLVVACSNCNKIEFHKLHMVYMNDVDSAKCPSDTFYVNINRQYTGKGTYTSGNTFYAEVSDGSGKFTNPTIIGKVTSTKEPEFIALALPANNRFLGTGYKLRIRSTSPVHYSINDLDLFVPYVPQGTLSPLDTLSFCNPSSIMLGKMRDSDSGLVKYTWVENGTILGNTLPFYTKNYSAKSFVVLIKQPLSKGCTIIDSVWLNPGLMLSIPFNDSLFFCENSLVGIGGDSISNSRIEWSSKKYPVIRTEFNPVYRMYDRDTFKVVLKAIKGVCSSQKTIYTFSKSTPDFSFKDNNVFTCASNPLLLEAKHEKGNLNALKYKWLPIINLSNNTARSTIFQNTTPGKLTYSFISKDTLTNCSDTIQMVVNTIKKPLKPVVAENFIGAVIRNFTKGDKYDWYKDGNFKYQTSTDSQYRLIGGETKLGAYKVVVSRQDSVVCMDSSNTFQLKDMSSLSSIRRQELTVYPNPAHDKLTIVTTDKIKDILIMDISGRVCVNQTLPHGNDINISVLNTGYYIIQVNFEGYVYRTKFIKN